MNRGIFGGSLMAAVIVLAAPRTAEACSCVVPPPPKKALTQSTAVFEGKVVALAHDPDKHQLTATFAVTRRWKGAETAQVAVTTIDIGSMCGLTFVKDEAWMIYASGEPGALSTGLCTRSQKQADAAADRKALGVGKPPVKGPGIADPLASGPTPTTGPTPAPTDPLASGPTPTPTATPTGDPLGSGPTPAPAADPPAPAPAAAAPASPPAAAQPSGCRVGDPAGAVLLVVPMVLVARRRGRA